MNFEKHVFICTKCTFMDSSGQCSSPDQAAQFRKDVKAEVKSKFPDKHIRVNASGCLGQCEKGISCVIYPLNEWLTELRPGDNAKILEKL